MRRPWEKAAYGPDPVADCWWAKTVAPERWGSFSSDDRADVAIVGGGFTGISAALHLARAGLDVRVLEAQSPYWGASGRNGGFCCLGGAKQSDAGLRRLVGEGGRLAWCETERRAVELVADLIDELALEVDRHSDGETLVAHRPRDWDRLRADAEGIRRDYGVTPVLLPADAMPGAGLGTGFHGALTTPVGFALNPRKYLAGLAGAARAAGARLYDHSPVMAIEGHGPYRVKTDQGSLAADRVILATGGYSSDDLPGWMASRFLPLQSSVIVTRPLTSAEQAAASWTSEQMVYDTRNLLHYFRLMPDGRFLFGMRGGLSQTPRAVAANRRAIRRDFHAMFPEWRDVDIVHYWSGLVCFTRQRTPFVGAVPDMPGLFAGFAYHGNGVAMASYSGALLAQQITGTGDLPHPDVMKMTPRRFPFGLYRRFPARLAYAAYALQDR